MISEQVWDSPVLLQHIEFLTPLFDTVIYSLKKVLGIKNEFLTLKEFLTLNAKGVRN